MRITERQLQIPEQLCLGLQNKQIANVLAMSERCVEIHRQRLMTRTGSLNAVQLGMWAAANLEATRRHWRLYQDCRSVYETQA